MLATQPKADTSLLSVVQDAISTQKNYMVPMHSQTLVVDMFCRGRQDINTYDPVTTNIELVPEEAGPNWAGYNLFRGTLTRGKAMLLESSPKREARPIGPEVEAIESAKLAKIVIDDFWHRFEVGKAAHICADAYIKAGVCVASFALDPTKGEVIGQDPMTGKQIRTGQLVPRWDTADMWIFDPRGRTVEECEWAARLSVQTTEQATRWFPNYAKEIQAMETVIGDAELMQARLMNSTRWQGRYTRPTIRGKGRVVVVEWYERPCDAYPKGRHEMFVGSTSVPALQTTNIGMMPSWTNGDLPVVVGVQDVSSYCLFGNGTYMTDLIAPQREITKRAHQELLCADAIGNPKIAVPSPGGVLNQHLTNDPFSPFIPYDPTTSGPPSILAAPQMGAFVKEAKEFALQMFGSMAPASPVDRQVAEKTTSGFHAAIITEERRQSNATFVRNWEDFFDSLTKAYFKFWKRSTVWPQQLRGIGAKGEAILRRISGFDLVHDVEVGIVKGSMEPQNRIASFAQWSDLLGKGYGNPMNPLRQDVEARMLSDIGKGDMTATWQSLEAPQENADDILVRLIQGQPFVPRLQDDAESCFATIRSYMQTDQYRGRLLRDPHLEVRLTAALDQFGQLLMMKQANMMNAQMMAAGGGGAPGFGEPNPVQSAASTHRPGAPQGGRDGKAFQGISSSTDPNRDMGGNPG